ncbi:MAG TPA: DUF2892 domain-containing protein [Albitalea sp.]|uniref:YgaP family membrane protein n=1 Tax=Piscinibacter sp. TaxID=1903157 RepID=UPI002ED43B7F
MSPLNIGNIDRVLRILVGIVLIALAVQGSIGWWGYAGVVLLLTGVAAFCPIYRLLGLSTTSR